MSTLAGNLSKRTLVVPLPAAKTGMKKGHKGPIPVAEAGDLPPSTPVVTLSFAKKHWGKAILVASALGVGALALHKKSSSKTLPTKPMEHVRNNALSNGDTNKPSTQTPPPPPISQSNSNIKKIAIIGTKRSGKTALVNLLLGTTYPESEDALEQNDVVKDYSGSLGNCQVKLDEIPATRIFDEDDQKFWKDNKLNDYDCIIMLIEERSFGFHLNFAEWAKNAGLTLFIVLPFREIGIDRFMEKENISFEDAKERMIIKEKSHIANKFGISKYHVYQTSTKYRDRLDVNKLRHDICSVPFKQALNCVIQ